MNGKFAACVGLSLMLFSGACSTKTAKSEGDQSTANAIAVPADSPLAKVHNGMSKKEVTDILGPPTDETAYASGKAWIPFYFGNDVRRTSWFYKGIGRVVFADGNVFGGGKSEVVRVDYDPSESGVAR